MRKLLIVLLVLAGLMNTGWTQSSPTSKNPKKLVKEAGKYEKSGDYSRAAVHYEAAYQIKKNKPSYIYDAGRCYLEARDYAKAVECLEKVKDKNKDYDKPGYKYALALKQNGQYEEATTAFIDFIGKYNDKDKLEIDNRVKMEIQGCNLALKTKNSTNSNIRIEHLPTTINTDKTESAPLPFEKDVLYFSSTVDGELRIYRTKKVGENKWSSRQSPSIFSDKMEKPHFGNGTFTPDGKRFYFTQCNLNGDKQLVCSIYLLTAEEVDGKTVWSQPIRLPDYINVKNSNTTHPFVMIEAGKEVLYFASDCEGGQGGLDIWYCTTTPDSNGNNFTLPKNLGRNINTPGDEITPFYHAVSKTLYFSSDGHASRGGLDVFKSKGAKLQWTLAENLDFPINSAADDLYYVISEGHGGGYLVSNRRANPDKVSTIDNDIFRFLGKQKIEVRIEGKVYAERDPDQRPLQDIRLQVFENVDGKEELVKNKRFSDGRYEFTLKGGKNYLIKLSKPDSDFSAASFEVKTNQIKYSDTIHKDIGLKKPEAATDAEDPEDSENPADSENLLYRIVPPEYDSEENPYSLPYEPPFDPETGESYAEGTAIYDLFQQVDTIAQMGSDRKVYYDDLEKTNIVPYIEKQEAVEGESNPTAEPVEEPAYAKGPVQNFDPETDYVAEAPNIRFKIQVAAVRSYKESRYEELQKLVGIRLAFEPLKESELTRVLIIPEDNSDYTTKADALDALFYVVEYSKFKSAYVCRYIDNVRTGQGFRTWEEETEDEE